MSWIKKFVSNPINNIYSDHEKNYAKELVHWSKRITIKLSSGWSNVKNCQRWNLKDLIEENYRQRVLI